MLPALATAAFLEMIGVNAHIEYTDTPYADVGKVLTDLAYIDVQSVRDAAPDPHNAGQWGYAMLADHGVKFDFFIPGWTTDLGAVQRSIDAFVKAHPGSVMAIEGPNEIENWPVSYHGHKDVAAAASFQRDLYARFHGDPLLDHVPVYDLTFSTGLAGLYPVLGDMDDACDVGTDHSYFGHGRLPFAGACGTYDAPSADGDHGNRVFDAGARCQRAASGDADARSSARWGKAGSSA
jgi:hypothetical protein